MRCVHNHDEAAAFPGFAQQPAVELFMQGYEVLLIANFASNFCEQEPHEFARGALGLEDIRRLCGSAEALQQVNQERGLAHSRLGDERHKTTALIDAIEE
jgi:hypothetical protein